MHLADSEARAQGARLDCCGVEATDSGSLMSGRNWVKGRAGRKPCRGGGKAGEEGAHVWFLFCDREQRCNWRLGELFGLSSICNKSSSISSPQTPHRLPRLLCLMLMRGHTSLIPGD